MLEQRKIKIWNLILAACFCFLLASCSNEKNSLPVEPDNGVGKVLLKFDKASAPSNVVAIAASMTRSGFETITKELNILSDSTADLSIQNLSAGTWHLKIDAKNTNGSVIYSGETDVTIIAATIIQISLTLQPTTESTGSIYIYVSWAEPEVLIKWKIMNSGTTANLNSLFFMDSLYGWVVGNNGTILRTRDAGISWQAQRSGVTSNLNSVLFKDFNVGWAVGDNGIVLKTTTGGNKWELMEQVTTNSLYSIKFYNAINGLIFGENGTVIYVYGEDNEFLCKSIGYPDLLLAAHLLENSTTGWTVSNNGNIYRTTDLGANWVISSNTAAWGKLQSIAFSDSLNGIVVGNSGLILKTLNSGTNWNIVYAETDYNLRSVYYLVNSTFCWVTGASGIILKTSNRGFIWEKEKTESTNDLNALVFINVLKGWAVGNNGTILKYYP